MFEMTPSSSRYSIPEGKYWHIPAAFHCVPSLLFIKRDKPLEEIIWKLRSFTLIFVSVSKFRNGNQSKSWKYCKYIATSGGKSKCEKFPSKNKRSLITHGITSFGLYRLNIDSARSWQHWFQTLALYDPSLLFY